MSTTADSSSASQGTSAPPEQSLAPSTADVQGATPEQPDPLADLPSVEELNQQAEQGVKYAKALANLRGVIDPLRTQHTELTQKYEPFQAHLERFEQPEQLGSVLQLHDSLIGWEQDPDTGEPIPATQQGAQLLATQYPQHADFLVADLLGLPTTDPATGRQVPRIDYVLESLAADPDQRQRALKILGGVEPSAVAPQWQPTDEELAVVRPELQDTYRKLPYEEREELKLASPDYINRTLEREKFTQQLQQEKEQNDARVQQEAQQREQYVNSQAVKAGNDYVQSGLNQTLATFVESAIPRCEFLKPIDAANIPQGMTAEQVAQYNQQASEINTAEAVTMIASVVSLFNEQTKSYILPYLKKMGAVDDKMLAQLDKASSSFGNNGRNYGNISYRQQLQSNGQGYQPNQDVTILNNEAQRALKQMAGYANAVFGKLLEKKSQAFEMRATQYGTTLNGSAQVRPPLNGTGYNPTTAAATGVAPLGKMTRDEINARYG